MQEPQRKRISYRRIKRLERAKQELDRFSGNIQRILDGNMTQEEAAKIFGIPVNTMEANIGRQFYPYLKSKDILTRQDILSVLTEAETGCERLVKDIFGLSRSQSLVIIHIENQEAFLKVIPNYITEHAWKMLSMRYHLEDPMNFETPMRYSEIADTTGVSRQNARSIILRALVTLREPAILMHLIPEYESYVQILERHPKYIAKQMEYKAKLVALESIEENTDDNYDFEEEPDICDLFIEDMPFSTHVKHALIMHSNIRTVRELASRSKHELYNIRGIGKAAMRDIEDVLQKHGLYIR